LKRRLQEAPVAASQTQTLVPFLVIGPLLALMVWRNIKGRRVRVEALWIRPVILLAMASLAVSQTRDATAAGCEGA
jgi:peptidoglycan/LPS O-acetylase OafA/YrhL